MKISLKHSTSGFTLVEMIVVISIILILFGISMFPYRYYMQRAYVERSADGLAQEWVLAHKAIRGGIQLDSSTPKHAHLFFVFERGKSEIQSYLYSGSTDSATFILPDLTRLTSDNSTPYKTYSMDDGIIVLGFTGSLSDQWDKVGYMIAPPYGDGVFFTGTTYSGSYTDARIIVGYNGANTITGRAREVLLRPYLR